VISWNGWNLETKRLLEVNILFGMAIASALCLLHNFNTCILFKAHVATLPHLAL